MSAQPTNPQPTHASDPAPEPVGKPNSAETGELGSEGGSQAELVQTVRGAGPDSPSVRTGARASWSTPALLVTIVLTIAIVYWLVAYTVGC